ncbi:TadE/TadG family type IV pilus assembly protein [Methylobacterium sp. SyP6R]|uniref:TadE/TadG family type IV pilus assembly protein n=1 Tax=Methylobacterium sp. SyP6R TaxID=2718876 RepID=UPI001F2FA1E3|nr:TadE/TadG family type IV pilus assembly protein [Methylobacterium sp. SyP6R]MCF4126995.1 pilus assembly protein [Methylobacterium sp. SyP6R]
MIARGKPGRPGAGLRLRRDAARFGRGFARYSRAQDGVAAVEFAMVLPLLVLLYFGATDLAGYVSNFRKVTLSARAVADLLAREGGDVSPGQFAAIVRAGRAVLAPYDGASARIAAKAIGVYDANGRARVCSYQVEAGNAAAPAPSGPTDVPTVPDAYKKAGARYLVVELTMAYKPIFAAGLAKRFNLGTQTETVIWPVRNGKVYNVAVTSNPEVVLPTVVSNSNGGACPVP